MTGDALGTPSIVSFPSSASSISIISAGVDEVASALDDEATALEGRLESSGNGLKSFSLPSSAAGMVDLFRGLPSLILLVLPLVPAAPILGKAFIGELPAAEDGVRMVVDAGEELTMGLGAGAVAKVWFLGNGEAPVLGLAKKPIRVDCLELYYKAYVSQS